MTEPVEPIDATFDSGGDACAAWVWHPGGPAPAPVVVLGHGLGAVRDMGLARYARHFVAEGLAVVAFDYRHLGDSEGSPRQVIDVGRQLDDWAAAIGFARGLAGVDPGRVALWGTSFAGGHVLVAAEKDGDIAAVVAQCPFTDGMASAAAVNVFTSARLMAAAAADEAARLVGRIVTVPVYGPPGSVALLTAPDCEEGYAALVPEGSTFENRASARLAVQAVRYLPGRSLPKLTCPVLLCVCDDDTVAPAETAVRYARDCPSAEVVRYPIGHFDIYQGDRFEQAVADQAAFLVRSLLP